MDFILWYELRIKGDRFSDDGGDCVYCIKPDGAITCFNSMDNDETQIADTLWDFLITIPLYWRDHNSSQAVIAPKPVSVIWQDWWQRAFGS